jgi:hypothetical protein
MSKRSCDPFPHADPEMRFFRVNDAKIQIQTNSEG